MLGTLFYGGLLVFFARKIADLETIILLERCQKHWRSWFNADENGYTNFLWTFLHHSEDKQIEFLEFIEEQMNLDPVS